MKKYFKRIISFALIGAMILTSTVIAGVTPTVPNHNEITEREIAHRELATEIATQGVVLLENNGALPMASSGNIALFGLGAKATVKGGTGSGAVNNRSYPYSFKGSSSYNFNNKMVWQAFDEAGYNITSPVAYYSALPNTLTANRDSEILITEAYLEGTSRTDTAIYVVARQTGEFADNYARGASYYLSDNERANLELLGERFDTVIVVLNCGNQIDTQFYHDINAANPGALDALVVLGQAGQEGGEVLRQVLTGEVTPSGKLAATWAADYSYFPASETFSWNDGDELQEDYIEGIYVGYRYFDSFYKELNPEDPDSVVLYEFGYGASYTDFEIEIDSVDTDIDYTTVEATVTNIGGTYSGKEVVQVYFSAPTGAGKLHKPYQELIGYAKTDLLGPGESQTLTISFLTTEMSSYDEAQEGYVMDSGDYIIRVGNSSRNTEVAAVITLDDKVVTEQLKNQLTDEPFEDGEVWESVPANHYSYAGEAAEIAAAPRFELDFSGFETPNNASPYEQDVEIGEDEYLYRTDGDLISSINVYLPENANWENTGTAYGPKTGETVVPVEVKDDATLYDVYFGEITMEQFVAGLSVQQMGNIIQGSSVSAAALANVNHPHMIGPAGSSTILYQDLGIPSVAMPDGPAGIRASSTSYNYEGETYYQWFTNFLGGMLLAQTWDVDLVYQFGAAIGAELAEAGGGWWLAPGINLYRDPLCGRNFEYYSEDPFVTGQTATYAILGIQSNPGNGVALKHYFGNNQEQSRNRSNSHMDQRAMRELYLKGFEMAVKNAQPATIMSSYNKVNSRYCAADYDTLYDILRGEWNFQGLVMTDWGQLGRLDSVVEAMYAGNDLIMPGNNAASAVMGTTLSTPAEFDVNGVPVYEYTEYIGVNSYNLSLGGFQLSEDGTTVYSFTVDGDTDLSSPLSTKNLENAGAQPIDGFDSVNDAYNALVAVLESEYTNLSAAEKAGITIEINDVEGTVAHAPAAADLDDEDDEDEAENETEVETEVETEIETEIVTEDETEVEVEDEEEDENEDEAEVFNMEAVNETVELDVEAETEDDDTEITTQAAGDVLSYTVTYTGNYNTTMRLGDLQRSVRNILGVMMNVQSFGALAEYNGVEGVNIVSYTDYNSAYLTDDYQVIDKGGIEEAVYPTNVAINSSALTIVRKGATLNYGATLSPSNATVKELTWTSSNPNIAVVNAKTGEITVVGQGMCQITATSANGVTSTIYLSAS